MHDCDESPLVCRLTESHAVKHITHSCTSSLKSISQEPKKQHLSAISPSAAEQVPAVKESNVKSNHQTARYSFRCLIDSSSASLHVCLNGPSGGNTCLSVFIVLLNLHRHIRESLNLSRNAQHERIMQITPDSMQPALPEKPDLMM